MSPSRSVAALSGLSLLVAGLTAAAVAPASATPAGDDIVISEVYGGGGNSGAPVRNDFVELYNPTAEPIDVTGLTVSYYSSSGNSGGNHTLECGTVPAGGHFLIWEAAGSNTSAPQLPAADAEGSLTMASGSGSIEITRGTDVVDLVGYGSAARREGADAPGLSNTTSASRDATGTDTDDNSADFTAGSPDAQNDGADRCEPAPPSVTDATIAEIQGDGASSPMAGDHVRTRGVITAAYPDGGFYSFVIQTPGTGSGEDATPGESDAVWVVRECCGFEDEIQVGQYVEVVGTVQEEFGRTQISYDPADDELSDLTVLDEPFEPVAPLATDWWTSDEERESHEGELLDLSGQHFTVTDNYGTNQYGEVGLAAGDTPLISPTEVANPVTEPDEYAAVEADNAARGVVLDDGSSWDYIRGSDFVKSQPLPWIDQDTTARVNAGATVTGPVVLDYGFGDWRIQPTHQVNGPQPELVSFEDTRPENEQPQDVGGDLRIATFNVLNYFPTTGMEWEASGAGTCSYYTDRAGDEVTDNRCEPDGPRGAAEDEDLQRQQDKIVAAINDLDADVVSLEEIENSVKFGKDRDDALAELTRALNEASGTERWAYVPSPPANKLPPLENQDVIRTAFIYNPDTVEPVGPSRVLVGSDAFSNARKPVAQVFFPEDGGKASAFGVIANHFKSKGSACDEPGESSDPQGNCNGARVAQAHALVSFADDFLADRKIERLFLAGDFNAYSAEDPVRVLEDAGYTDLGSDTADEWSYSFDGMSGSLDHVFANEAALADVTGSDIWEVNANEAVAFEYSRYNYNVTQFYSPDVFRASDHNPEVVGLDVSRGHGHGHGYRHGHGHGQGWRHHH